MSTPFGSFPEFLSHTLRVEDNVRVYHVHTNPAHVKSIFSPLPPAQDTFTTCESHFLAISRKFVTNDEPTHSDTNGYQSNREVLILGIEILIIDTPSLKTIFVSKADSTGLILRTTSPSSTASSSIIRTVISTFIEWLLTQNLAKIGKDARQSVTAKPQLPSDTESIKTCLRDDSQSTSNDQLPPGQKKLVLSLFARSQNQYLFPGSIENSTKHVLDDRQLIKWWCKLLDRLVQRKWDLSICGGSQNDTTETTASVQQEAPPLVAAEHRTSVSIAPKAYVIVPGCDRADTARSFFPPSSLTTSGRKWHNAFPVEHLAGRSLASAATTSIPARCLIPRLPDDPKARFCDDLDAAGTDDKGQWKTVKSISQFWEMMEYRQECAAGRLVGFVWVIFDMDQSQDSATEPSEHPSEIAKSDTANGNSQQNGYVEGTDVKFPPTAPASVLLSSEQYIELSDLLINDTDFAGFESAADSTEKWTDKVKSLSGVPLFGVEVSGSYMDKSTVSKETHEETKLSSQALNGKSVSNEPVPSVVNTLIGVRKKKRDAQTAGVVDAEPACRGAKDNAEQDTTNVLASGLVRKKPKIQ